MSRERREGDKQKGHVFRYLPEEGFEGEDHITLKAFADPPITMSVRVTVYHADLQRQQQADDERRALKSLHGSSGSSLHRMMSRHGSSMRVGKLPRPASMGRPSTGLMQPVGEDGLEQADAAPSTHLLNVVVVQAKGLVAIDRHLVGGRSSDPFVKLSWNGQEGRTTFKKKTLAPFWGELLCFDVSMAELREHGELGVLVEDCDTMGLGFSGGFLGSVKVPLRGLREGHEVQAWHPLEGAQGKDGVDRGMVELRLMVYEHHAAEQATSNPLQAFCEAQEDVVETQVQQVEGRDKSVQYVL